MGLFNSPEKQMLDLEKKKSIIEQERTDIQQAMNSVDPERMNYDSQVSALILQAPNRFLKWLPDSNGDFVVLAREDIGFLEPYGDEPLSFINEKVGDYELLNNFDATLAEIYGYGEKYEKDERVKRLFNNVVMARRSMLVNSRTTGKPGKLAKSQFVDTSSFIKREGQDFPKKQKFLGWF